MLQEENGKNNSSTDDLEKLRKQAANSKSLAFVEDDKLQPLHDYLCELKEKFLEDEEYIEARDTSELLERCKNEIQFRSESSSKDSKSQQKTNKSVAGQMVSEYVFSGFKKCIFLHFLESFLYLY